MDLGSCCGRSRWTIALIRHFMWAFPLFVTSICMQYRFFYQVVTLSVCMSSISIYRTNEKRVHAVTLYI